jgi:hypothetical protein
MTKSYAVLVFLLVFSACANAQVSRAVTEANGVIEYATPPELIADAIVIFVPNTHMSLHRPEAVERVIDGRVTKIEKGKQPNMIVHNANTMISPLEANVPVRLFLKRFPDRDAYYPIAIFPLSSGVQP